VKCIIALVGWGEGLQTDGAFAAGGIKIVEKRMMFCAQNILNYGAK
jgi:hypothetical protein